MGKASRQRRLNKEKERQRQRAARGAHLAVRGWDTSRDAPGSLAAGPGELPDRRGGVRALRREPGRLPRPLHQLANERAPGWTQAVSRSLVESLRLSVTAAWRAAGSPPSWPGISAGSFPTAHAAMAADMIADEMRGYAAATVDARWAAQVAALDAPPQAAAAGSGAWWGSDAEYLAAWTRLAGRRRVHAARSPPRSRRCTCSSICRPLKSCSRCREPPGRPRSVPSRKAASPPTSGCLARSARCSPRRKRRSSRRKRRPCRPARRN